MTGSRQVCTFRVAGLVFGVEVERVREVLRYQELTHVPLAPRVVCGLINLRGEIVTAIDLRRRLDLAERAGDQRPMNVVIDTLEGVVSLLVDEIGDVLPVADESCETPPATLQGRTRGFIRAACKLPDCLLLLLDIDAVAKVAPLPN